MTRILKKKRGGKAIKVAEFLLQLATLLNKSFQL